MKTEFTTYLLALEVAPMKISHTYAQLPMHCTIVPRFHSALSPEALAVSLAPAFAAAPAVTLSAGNHVAFGPKKQLVTLLVPMAELVDLHQTLFGILSGLGVQYTERDWVGDGFVPHVTDKQGKRLPSSKPMLSRAAYLISVEHPLEGHNRFVHTRFGLASEES